MGQGRSCLGNRKSCLFLLSPLLKSLGKPPPTAVTWPCACLCFETLNCELLREETLPSWSSCRPHVSEGRATYRAVRKQTQISCSHLGAAQRLGFLQIPRCQHVESLLARLPVPRALLTRPSPTTAVPASARAPKGPHTRSPQGPRTPRGLCWLVVPEGGRLR